MRALDAIRDTGKLCCGLYMTLHGFLLLLYHLRFMSIDLPFHELGGTCGAVTGKRFRTWLLQLRNSQCLFRDSLSSLIDTVLDGYNKARHGAEVGILLCSCERNITSLEMHHDNIVFLHSCQL